LRNKNVPNPTRKTVAGELKEMIEKDYKEMS